VYQNYAFFGKGSDTSKLGTVAEHLLREGCKVSLLTVDYDSRWDTRRENVNGTEIIWLGKMAQFRAMSFSINAIPFCRQNLREFDLVHIYGYYDLLTPIVAHYCHQFGIPYFFEPMGMFRPVVRNLGIKRVYQQMIGHKIAQHARCAIATSEQEQRELLEEGLNSDRVVMRRNGIDTPASMPTRGEMRVRFGIPEGAHVTLFFGRVVGKKSPDMLIRAFARAALPTDKWLVIAGPHQEDDYKRDLISLATSLGVKDRVVFTGAAYGHDKWAMFVDADIFVLPSQHENFGNTAVESAACGTPVILTNTCGVSQWIDGRAGLVIDHDEQALINALERISNDGELRTRLTESCPQVASELSWSEPVKQMLDLYRSAMAS